MNDTQSSGCTLEFLAFQENEVGMENMGNDDLGKELNAGFELPVPISKLYDDILLLIFKINANMEQDEPLRRNKKMTRNTPRAMNTTFNSSQVSSRWRNLINNSPLLWANLIDIHALNWTGNCWRKEVLQRTKGFPLHVKGLIDLNKLDTNDGDEPWWVGFFNDIWERIRIFDIVVVNGWLEHQEWVRAKLLFDRQPNRPKIALRFLTRPTATLESFHLNLPSFCNPLDIGFSLFDGHAPRLRSLQMQNVRIPQWPTAQYKAFSQIENLHVLERWNEAFASVHMLLDVLSLLPRLQTLYLNDAIAIGPHTTSFEARSPVHVPSLKRIVIARSFKGSPAALYWQILKGILPKPDCSVRFVLNLDPTSPIDVDTFTQYANNYFRVNSPTKLVVVTSNRAFRLSDTQRPRFKTELNDLALDHKPVFDFDLDFHYPQRDERLYELFDATFSLSLPSVITLLLEVSLSHQGAFADPRFGSWLASLSSVQHLVSTPETLHAFHSSSVIDITTVFPRLKLFSMPLEEFMERVEDEMPTPIDILTTFLTLRKKANVPISVFEYKPGLGSDSHLMDLTFLDAFTGLRVQWNIKPLGRGKYICGSGNPEELDFKERLGALKSV